MTDRERVQHLRDAMGEPDPRLRQFPDAIRAIVFAKHTRYVEPLLQKHWPACRPGGREHKAYKKLRFLACNLYATAPYTVLFSALRPPFVVRLARAIGSSFALKPAGFAAVGARAMPLVSALLDEEAERRIVQIAAFIAAIDHVFDHCMSDVDIVERGRRMRGLLHGSWLPTDLPGDSERQRDDKGALRYVRALQLEMSDAIHNEHDKRQFDRALETLHEYVDCEVKALTHVVDPSGTCWRGGGVRGTIDGLIFPVHRYAGEVARQWMYDVSWFVQVMDDFLDAEKDAKEERPTPVLTGFWGKAEVTASWQKTLDGIVAMAKESGVHDEHYLAFVKETYRMMAIEVMEAMGGGSAA